MFYGKKIPTTLHLNAPSAYGRADNDFIFLSSEHQPFLWWRIKERISVPSIISQTATLQCLSDTRNHFPNIEISVFVVRCLRKLFFFFFVTTKHKKKKQAPVLLKHTVRTFSISFALFNAGFKKQKKTNNTSAYLVCILAARNILPGAHHDTISANAD